MRKLFVSTGTMVGRLNNYNYNFALSELSRLYDDGLCDGAELMMLNHYYDKADPVINAVKDCGVPMCVIHCEKDIGLMLSDAGKMYAENDTDAALKKTEEAMCLFRINCEFAGRIGIERMVLHLWGGLNSDMNIDYNISKLSELSVTASEYGVKLLIENIPSQKYDPLSNWHRLLHLLGENGLIFDTRFGQLHDQSEKILTDKEITKHIEHIHISDFGGGYRDFSALRPILHPGEGRIDFDEIARLVDFIDYDGTFTLESPVTKEDGWDLEKQRKTLLYLRKLFKIGIR